ncbi:MAG: hypothetical protein LUD47_03145, partial [Clostridia bacterium]|nr:hypothetical protein [Clostridia bacterium]
DIARYVAAEYYIVYGEDTGYTVVSSEDFSSEGCEARLDMATEDEKEYTIYYSTLEAALGDAEDGDTVTLLTDVSSTPEKTYIVGSDITLNLDGHTLTGSIETSSGTEVEINLGGGEVTGGITANGDLKLSLGKNGSTETFGSVEGGVTVYGDAEISLGGGTIKGGVTLYGDSEVSFGGGEIEGGLTLSGGEADMDLEGGTVTGGISVTSGADAKIDLGGGKIYGDISVSGGSALSISDSSSAAEENISYGSGLVIGEISTDNGRSSVEISGGTYSYDVTDLVSDGLVVFVGSYTYTENCETKEIRVYTVMSEKDAQSLSEASRTYENGAGDTVTVYYDGIGDALGDLLSGDVLTIWATITPESGDELVISGADGSAVKNVTVDLNGNEIEGGLTVSGGSSVVLDLNGGKVSGDITAEAGSSLYVTDTSEKEEGIVTGKVSGDASAVEIDAGTYGNNVLGYITDGKVIYVNAVKECGEGNTYTVTTAEEISGSGKHVGATVTYDKDGKTVTVYFESSVDAVEYAKEVSTDGVTAYVTLYETIDYTGTSLDGIETADGNDIVINLNGHGITGNITVVSGSSLTIEDTDPQTYDGDVTGVELVDGEISVTGGTLSVTGGIYTDDISGYLSEDDFALVSSYVNGEGEPGKIYEIVGEDLAKELSVVSVSTDGEKPVYYADADAAVSDTEEKLNGNAEANLTIVVVADSVTGADFSLPSGDVTIDLNGNTLEGDITLGTEDGETKVTLTFTDSGAGDDGMTGGGFTGTVGALGEDTDSEVILEAGTYNKDAFDGFDGGLTFAEIRDGDGNVVDRYVPVYGDETFTVIPESAAGDYSVAGVDLGDGLTVYFTDIDDALGYAAENGGTLTLYADAESSAEINITADVTIDLNGHSLVAANVVIYADEGGTLTITDEGEGGRFKGLVTAEVSDEGYSEEENPYKDTIVLEIKPMEGELVVTVVTDAENAEGSVSECYVFSETENGFGIVNIADHTHRYDVPVWEYMTSGEFEGMIKLTFKCACGKFDDFVGYYQITATENEDGSVTFTAEAEIFSEAHKGTYTYDETKKVAARVNVDGRTIYYEDMKEALEAAEESGATLVLMDDFSGELSVSSDVTVDLNGHDVSGEISVSAGATLEIEGEGRVDAEITLGDGAEILVGGGTYDDGNFDDVYENLADGCAVVIGKDSNGNTIYTVCDVTAAVENSEAAIIRDGETTYYESVEDAVNELKEGDTLVLWDDVESGLTIDADKTGNIEIDLNGKEILGGINIESSGESGGTTVTVTDSTSEGGKGDGKVVGGITAGEEVTLVIEGGTFGAGTGSSGAEGEESSDGGNAYDEDLIRDFTAEDKVIFNNADGSISVVDGDVAETLAGAAVTWTDDDCVVHREYYETLQDAVEDAEDLEGAVVTLYGDNPSDITVSGDVTIDLNGHTEDGDMTVNAGATLTLTDSSDDNSGTVDGKIVTEDPSSGEEKSSGKVILSGGTYDFGSFDEGTLENVSLGEYTDENGETKIFVAVYGDLETSVDGDGNETVSGNFTVMTEGEAQESGAVKVTVATTGGDDAADVYFKDFETAMEYATETDGKVTLYGDAEAEKVIEITGNVEIDLNGHTLDADMVIDAVTYPEASLKITDSTDVGGELKGTVTVILDDSSSAGAYAETLTVDGSIDISDLDVSLKDGSADGDDAKNFVFEAIDADKDGVNDYYKIAGGDEHVHAYELVSVVYDEKSCTVTIVIKCACGDVFTAVEKIAVTFGDYDGGTGTVVGTAGIETDADGDGINETYDFDITLTPAAGVVTEDGGTYYFESIDDAIAFAAEKDAEGDKAEIILLTDVENIIVTGDENVVIDLNGHTVTGTVSVDEDASLTIKGTGEIDAQIDVRGDLTIEGGDYCESEEKYEGRITICPDDSIDVAEGGTLTIEGVVEIILDGTDLDIGSTYVEAEDGDTAQFEFSYGVVIVGDLTITVTGDSTLSAEGSLTITDGGSLTINIEGGTLTLDTDGNAVEAVVTVEDGANLLAEDTSGTNEGRLDGEVTVKEGGYVAFEDKTFADEGNGLEIVFEGNAGTESDKYIMESAADEYGETYQRSTTKEEHLSHGHAFDVIAMDEDGGYVYEFDPSMSLITLHFTCLCGEELTYFVYLTEDDYYAFVTETDEGDETTEIVEIVYSLTAVVVSTNGTSAEYGLYGTAYIPMFQRADDATRSDPESYVYSEDNPYYYGAEDASCTEGGEDVYIYGTQNGVLIRESVGIIHHGLEEVGVAADGRKIYHCTECGGYFMEGYTDIAGDAAYGDLSEIEKELEREEIFNETKDELLSELESRLTGCTGDYGAAKEAYDKAVSEIDDWEYEFGGGEAEDRDDYLESLLAEIERAAAEAEFVIAEETQKTISENELKDLFKDILDEDGNVTEKYEEYYSETARQQIRELYDTALQDLGNFGFSADDVEVTDSDSRYLEYTEWLEEMYGAFVQRIADELKSVDVIKVDTHEELSDEETMFSYVSNEDGMSGVIKLIITKVDGGKLDKAIGRAEIVSGDVGDSEMTEEEMQAALEGKSVIGVYDFKLWDTLSDVQVITFNGYYYVCLQLPEELQGRDDLQIVYLGDDGVLEVYRTYTDLDAGCLYFTTTHFSRYIIMGVEEKDLMPPIIVLSVFGGMELIALVILIAVFVVRKKKENVVEEDAPVKKKLAGLGLFPLLAVIIPTGAVGIIIGLAVANALLIAGIIVFIYLILTKTGKGVVEYELGSSSDGIAPSGSGTSLQDGLASNCSAIDEAKRNNS